MVNVIQDDQFQIVQSLIQRQDQALDELDALCDRVELAIKETIGSRVEDENQEPESDQTAAAA